MYLCFLRKSQDFLFLKIYALVTDADTEMEVNVPITTTENQALLLIKFTL